MRAFLLILMALITAVDCHSASREEPAYRVLSIAPQWHWQDGLLLSLPPDEAACRKAYGGGWERKCAAPIGRHGSIAKGVKLHPAGRGSWLWEGPYTLRFQPGPEGLEPGTTYTVDIAELPLPAYISLPERKVQVKAPPRSARLSESRFWLDPAPSSRHRLFFALEFNYPVAASQFKPELELPEGVLAGDMEAVWNEERDRVALSWPILKLPVVGGMAKLTLPDVKQALATDEGIRIQPQGMATFSLPLPANTEIFTIREAKIEQEKDANLDTKYILEISPSLYTDPQALVDNMLLVELPEFKSSESRRAYDWSNAPAISVKDLERGRLLKVQADSKGQQARLRYRIPVKAGRHVFVGIKDNIKSASGVTPARPFSAVVYARPVLPQAGFLQPGNILAGNGDIDIFGIGLDEIKWQIQLVDNSFLALVAGASRDSFADPLGDSSLEMDSLAQSATGLVSMKAPSDGEVAYARLNPAKIMHDSFGAASGLARVVLAGCKDGKQVSEESRLILVTDIALMAKRAADGSLDCFASSIAGGKPLDNIEISLAGMNGRPVCSGFTDRRGHIHFDSPSGLGRESRPVAVIARAGGNMAWLPLNERSREVDYSSFETSGRKGAADALAYVFSQRGLYRPGDLLHFGCLARRGDFSALPAELPLYGEIINPAGQRIWETRILPGAHGIAEISWQSLPESVSGKYIFNVRTARDGDILGFANVRLEAFQPDTLKMRVTNPVVEGWLVWKEGKPPKINAELRNLYGMAAPGHKIRAEARTAPAIFKFEKFRDYIFADPAPFIGGGVSRKLAEQISDKAGQAEMEMPAGLGGASAKITVACEGFDLAGARATCASATFLASPSDRILGYRLAGFLTNLEFIEQGADAKVDLLAIDSSLAPVGWKNLTFTLLKRSYVTSLVSDGDGGYRYDETPRESPLRKWTESLPARPFSVSLPTAEAGEYLLKIRAADGSVVMQLPYTVVGERLYAPGEALAGSKMRMRLDKKEFRAGDEIGISCALPYDCFGLIAIERDKVEAFEWVAAHAGDNMFRIRVPDNFEGRGYITASFMRKEDSKLIHMNPLAWAAVPFIAGVEKRDLDLKIDASQKALPGSILKVRLSAARPGKAVLFAVDEGILQLTGWRNPDPVDALLTDRALDVATLQTADLLMPPAKSISRRSAAFGGGMDGASPFGARFQNPFRRRNEPPVTFWSGLVEVGDEPTVIEIPIPSWYSGSVRIMAVGANSECADSATSHAAVAGPLVLTPLLPGFIAPGDEFGGTVVIANTTDQPAEASLSLLLPDSLQLLKGLPKSARLPAGGELAFPFRIKSATQPGVASIQFEAAANDFKLKRECSLSIRPAASLRTTLQSGLSLAPEDLPPGRSVYPYNASSEIAASPIPVPLGLSLAKYLETYPYGCTEQLLSRAFTVILLHNWPGANVDAAKASKLVNAAIDAIASRFNGQFVALWPQGDGDLMLTAYAADFLLALRESGLGAADSLLANLCDAVLWSCALHEPTLASARACAYALWILAREGRIVTRQLEELQAALASQGVSGWQEDVTAALLDAAKREMAMDGTGDFKRIRSTPQGWFDDYGQLSLLIALAARYYPESLAGLRKEDFFDASLRALNGNSYSTWSAAQGIRALKALAGADAPELASARIECLDADSHFEAGLDSTGKLLSGKTGQCARYRLARSAVPLYWQIATTGYDLEQARAVQANGIEIERVYLDPAGNPVRSAQVGDEIEVRITARSSQGILEDCVITDVLPGCLERIVTRHAAHPEGVKYLDLQEDRTLIFTNLQDQPLEYNYRCRVIAPGEFLVPPITAEAMYDQGVGGNGKSEKMTVSSE